MQEKPLNRDVIKYFAMFTMLLNHISLVFLTPGNLVSEIFTNIGYFTAVTMCWFLVEGYEYTRSKKRYALRLFFFALLSELPFCLALTHGTVLSFCGFNMIFTLLLCFGILSIKEHVENRILRVLAIAGLYLLSLVCDWALFAPTFTLLFCWAKGSAAKTKCAYGISALLFGLFNFIGGIGRFSLGQNLLYAAASMVGILLSGIAILYLYNGKRMEKGRTFSKWFFYLFYPVHLLILGLIRIALL